MKKVLVAEIAIALKAWRYGLAAGPDLAGAHAIYMWVSCGQLPKEK